jgi:predicted transcriptional regulator
VNFFVKVVETKYQNLAQGKGKGMKAESIDNQILALLKERPLSHGQIVQLAGKPKSTVSDVLQRLMAAGRVGQDLDSGGYYAL